MRNALALFEAGLLEEAAAQCRTRLAQDVNDLTALHLLGRILLRQGAAAEAVPLLALAAGHNDAAAVNELGEALQAAGLLDEAQARFEAARMLDPALPAPHFNLGCVLLARADHAGAIAPLRQAVALHPGFAEAWFCLAGALTACGEADAAEDCYRSAIAVRPDYVEALNNLGNALVARGQPLPAAALYRTALTHRPNAAELLLGLGNALLAAGDAAASEQNFRAALAARPGFPDAASNLGNALTAQHRLGEACAAYRAALQLDPTNHAHRYNYALALLLDGNFAAGWLEHEARRGVDRMRPHYQRRPELPKWQPGTDLRGRNVLVMQEQGFGDCVQFVRYAPLLAAQGAVVTVEAPPALQPVFASLAGIAGIVGPDDPAPGCDIGCPVMSLPLYFRTGPSTIPAGVPYASVPPRRQARWHAWLGPRRGRRIGVACSGRPASVLDRHRTMPLLALAPLFTLPDCEFILLQPGLRESDQAALAAHPELRLPGPELRDFGDTAALLAELDLVVTVDTALAHLAGALARPVWLMLPFVPDSRWLLHRRDSPWYPTMTLYRQQRAGAWDTVVEAVRHDLCPQ